MSCRGASPPSGPLCHLCASSLPCSPAAAGLPLCGTVLTPQRACPKVGSWPRVSLGGGVSPDHCGLQLAPLLLVFSSVSIHAPWLRTGPCSEHPQGEGVPVPSGAGLGLAVLRLEVALSSGATGLGRGPRQLCVWEAPGPRVPCRTWAQASLRPGPKSAVPCPERAGRPPGSLPRPGLTGTHNMAVRTDLLTKGVRSSHCLV